jgi:hypothetical protein
MQWSCELRNLILGVSFVVIMIHLLAGTQIPHSIHAQEGMMQTTDGGSLNVSLEPTWEDDGQALFKITFYEVGTDKVQRHVDFGFSIYANETQLSGQSALHTSSGIVFIPQNFKENGSYSLKISVHGVNFIPTSTEFVEFPVSVTPEFSTIIHVLLVASIATIIFIIMQTKTGMKSIFYT